MKSHKSYNIIIFLTLTCIFCATNGKFTSTDPSHAFDTDMYQSVLHTESCQRQLQYIVQSDDTLLRLQFVDAGLRIPRGIPNGNMMDLGNYRQCLSIRKDLKDMSIQGKYCTIRVSVNITNIISTTSTIAELNLDEHTLKELMRFNKEKSTLLERNVFGAENIIHNRESLASELELTLAVCVPQPCTTGDVLDRLLDTIPYEDIYCRLPNDKPLVTVDYVAWVVLILLCICTIASTCYDVNHTIIHKRDPKQLSTLFIAFSLHRNTHNLIEITPRPGTLECLDGIRSLSMFWVILGHTFAMGLLFPVNNGVEMFNWYHSLNAIWLKSATLSVDTFFLLSGLLLVYTTSHKITTVQLAKNLHIFYLSRLLRMFPALAAVVLLQASFVHHISDGPRWHAAAISVQRCRSHWWATLLHLQNFLFQQQGCLIVSWYLPLDIQLHLLSPLVLLWVVSGKRRAAWFGLICGVLISLAGAAVYVFVANWTHYRNEVYINVLCRSPTFFVGMVYGYVLNMRRGKTFVINNILGYFTTCFSIGMLAFGIYVEHVRESVVTNETIHNLVTSFGRTLWVTAVGWIIFACVNGYSGPINSILSWSIWKIPSRLSYATYLIHVSIMNVYYGSALQSKWFSPATVVFDFFAFLCLSLFVAFFINVLVEAPFSIIFKLLLERRRKIVKVEMESNKTDLNNSRPQNKF